MGKTKSKGSLRSVVERQGAMIIEQDRLIMRLQREVIISMANIIESRDGSTGEHIKRTAIFVEMLAVKLRERWAFQEVMAKEYFDYLCMAAPMHDIGKITVPDYILKSPTSLTKEEFEMMKNHPAAGGKIIRENLGKLESKQYIEIAADMATYHHERWDGTGYPEGLKGNDIPLCARIMAVADVFDALAFKRYYKEAYSLEESFRIIEESKGTHFDPIIVNALIEIRPDIEKMFREGVFDDNPKLKKADA